MSAAPEYEPSPTETAGAFVEGDLAGLVANLGDLSIDVPKFLDATDTAGAVQLLDALRAHADMLGQITDTVRRHVADRLGKGKHQVAGFQVEVKSGGGWTNWQHDKVAWEACRDIAADPATGEIVPEVADIVDRVRSRILNCAGVSYWRTTQLAPLNIDPAGFAEWKRVKRGVVITRDVEA